MFVKWRVVSAVVVMFVVLLVVVLVLPGGVKSAEEAPSVLVLTLNSIHRVWPPSPPDLVDKNYTLHFENGYVKTIDFNYGNRSFCYIHPRTLYRDSEFICAPIDNFTKTWELPKATMFPSQYSVGAMAYDWASGGWYFLDKHQQCIYVCDGTFQHCRMLRRDVQDPRGMALDPTPPEKDGEAAGFIFWSQKNMVPSRLLRSDLSGDDVTALLPTDCVNACYPESMTLDITNKRIFWIDYDTDTVQKSNYDGTGRTTVYTIPEAYNKEINMFSVFKSTIYMPGYRSVLVAPPNSNETYTNVYGFPSVTAVLHKSRQPKVSHPCAEKNGGCEHICTTAYEGVTPIARCLCQHGFQLNDTKQGVCSRVKLDSFMLVSRSIPPMVEVRPSPLADSRSLSTLVAAPVTGRLPSIADVDLRTEYLYFFDIFYRQIIRQKLDGTGREVFIKDGIGKCQGLAVDWLGGNLYWTDEQVGRVWVASLSMPEQRRELIKASFEHPSSIVLDPLRGVMYFSTWALAANPSGSIATANMDGTGRRTLVSDGLDWPSGLVLDAEKQILYWCDTRWNKIESLDLATNKRTTILAAPESSIKEPYGLVVIGGDVMWSERGTGLLRRASTGGNVTIVETMSPPLFDIRLVSRNERQGNNACSNDNGGCEELCLATPGGRTCASPPAGPRSPPTLRAAGLSRRRRNIVLRPTCAKSITPG